MSCSRFTRQKSALYPWGAVLRWCSVLCVALFLGAGSAHAGDGLLGIDHEWHYDNSGIWARKYQTDLEFAVIATEGVGALWLGNDDALGHEFWQSIDSTVVSGAAAQVLKYAFSRARPYQGNRADSWFQGRCCQSFPSGEVTLQASFVTPIILGEAARGHPWIWALDLYRARAAHGTQSADSGGGVVAGV
jgi:hypothetical protein